MPPPPLHLPPPTTDSHRLDSYGFLWILTERWRKGGGEGGGGETDEMGGADSLSVKERLGVGGVASANLSLFLLISSSRKVNTVPRISGASQRISPPPPPLSPLPLLPFWISRFLDCWILIGWNAQMKILLNISNPILILILMKMGRGKGFLDFTGRIMERWKKQQSSQDIH